ncbi:3-deoxy-D-manno-octulosonate 8-phosphate phosphatase [Fibrisoma montanum]|uniref:3-deoxy-D-manno-octulosonate 8-phosphate phosphatase n=1 Tax=Fibrisoma montanum TaxID=2305895 RepID=A0A418LYN8_9BACT|nr:3-deoxy-D-manno-octulosonate 8-phosphate phosphatase [Fibrisoma montanum]RIV18325.1 3-deoxy-D-manno-octulosonate 8-phosphate phosphatase [Fibrisoma montanum]
MSDLFNRFKRVKTFIFDVDGVLTDGSVNALDSGECFRTFYIHDAYAIQHAIRTGFHVAIISAANTEGVRKWLTILTVKDLFMGGPNDQKINAYLGFLTRDSLQEEEVLYMGDDIPDYEILRRPALVSTCPADAVDEVQATCDYVSPKIGGRGAVRDVIEQVMKAQSVWFNG